MTRAQKIWGLVKELESDNVEVLQKWIDEDLTNKFMMSTGDPVTISSSVVYGMNLKKEVFMALMGAEGFAVEYVCEDRPCESPRYIIRIPPQGE